MQIDTTLLPARGNDAVEILTNDHTVIKDLLSRLAAAEPSERENVLAQLKGVLTIHNATEENIVYPALNKVAGSRAESQHLYHETAEADVLLFELDAMLKDGDAVDFESRAEKFRDAVLHHIDEEEHKALPRLRDNVDAEQTESLADSVRTFRKSLHFETPVA
jgi:hemerythrin superfamily protein